MFYNFGSRTKADGPAAEPGVKEGDTGNTLSVFPKEIGLDEGPSEDPGLVFRRPQAPGNGLIDGTEIISRFASHPSSGQRSVAVMRRYHLAC